SSTREPRPTPSRCCRAAARTSSSPSTATTLALGPALAASAAAMPPPPHPMSASSRSSGSTRVSAAVAYHAASVCATAARWAACSDHSTEYSPVTVLRAPQRVDRRHLVHGELEVEDVGVAHD